MKTTYIYLNTYPNGYLYVGSHTWDGPEGQLDPEYNGTSYVAKHYGWHPIKSTILETVVSGCLRRERYWIEKYAIKYGIADCARLLSPKNINWMDKFAMHGLLINCHANDASQCHNSESFRKSLETRRLNGSLARSTKAALKKSCTAEVRSKAINTMRLNGTLDKVISKLHSAAHSKESAKKQLESRKRNGTFMQSIYAAHSKESMAKAQETRKMNGAKERSLVAAATPESRAKAVATKRRNARKVVCIETGFVGCTPEIAEYLNCSKSCASSLISKCTKNDVVSYKGLSFKFIRKC